jgi:pilus assembly protein CpaB
MQNKWALLTSLGVALFAVLMIFSYLSKKEQALIDYATPMMAVFAVKDIPEGVRLEESYLEEREIPKKYMQPGAIGRISEAMDRTLSVPALEGTQILESMFIARETEGIASKIPADMRAFSIFATDVTAVAELIQPGDFVDVHLTVEVGSFQEGQNVTEEIITKTILENSLVLALNQKSTQTRTTTSASTSQDAVGTLYSSNITNQEESEKLRTLTLSLSPEDTQRVNLAQEMGTLSVSLRSRWDKGKAESLPSLSAQDLLGIDKRVVPRSQPAWIEISGAEQIARY